MTLIVTPWVSLDPINLPKFLILVTFGFAAIGNLLPYIKKMIASEARILTYAVIFFLLALLVILVMSGSGFWAQIYGTYGRNTGLLAYMGLALMMLSVVFVSNTSFVSKLVWALISTGMVNAIYGMIQWSGNDPIDWNNPYNPIVGTLGNPNFVSAHLGIAGLASLALLLEKGRSSWHRFSLLTNIIISLFVVYQSNSSQGLLVFALGVTVTIYFRFVHAFHLAVRTAYWVVVGGVSLFGVFGILNKGPFASFLYQVSVTYRGDYWRAGWKMTMDHPIFGVGLDSYGDWYRFSRTEVAALRRGPDVTSNSAHNVFLDISSNGGFLLLIAYLLIVGLIIRSGWRVLRKSSEFDALGVGLVSAWLAYLIQSVISINQLGLAIWGWVLGGAIIGYDLWKDRASKPRSKFQKGQRFEQVSASVVLTGSLGLVFGFAISVWPVAQDIRVRSSLEIGDAALLEEATQQFPRGNYFYVFSSQLLLEKKAEEKALDLARLATISNPRDFNAWKMLVANPNLSETEKASAIARMRGLDPFNNTLDKQ